MRFCVRNRAIVIAVLTFFCVASGWLRASQWGAPPSASAFSISASQQMQPEELNRLLHVRGGEKPLVFQVGSHVLFAQAHIAGSEYVGAGMQAEGLAQLRARVQNLPRKTLIVLYCGCCPWNHCPNVGPAYKALADMGFTRAKVLYLPNNLGTDWVNKGFPVESVH